MPEARNLLPDAFAGTAEAYARYRPPYPPAMLAEMLREAGAPPDGAVLDLACGPGRIALGLADRVGNVVALDLEPEMIEMGRREASRRGLANIDWRVGPAESFEAPPGSFDLIAIGEAFHRLDQPLIARRAFGWLKPGGGLATLGSRGILRGPEPWQQGATEVARKWTAEGFPTGWAVSRTGVELTVDQSAAIICGAGFDGPLDRNLEEPHAWSFEGVLGYLQSTSVASRQVLGARFDAFAADLAATLAPFAAADGRWHEQLSFGCTLYRKPA
ncbi:MAG TPA: class I SAM-dependent methyltransferase [Caulobacteraceae bacterium]